MSRDAVLTSVQKGMWAMIGTSIALVIWTSGLLYMATKTEKKRVAEAQVEFGDEKNFESVPVAMSKCK